ncbi:uncharacterized protein C8A04DRAFT_15242 [Dichotomopilus funicola]|uniref:DUF1917-domain-containing protein n=1 Tax=Dichotomopilus funicola TaxID=1934379 RepID=A0AAN6UVX9_9PEZI|nr:hypothetical protein C8A04DRAFT_15242 [Dichotomopilus funicola]
MDSDSDFYGDEETVSALKDRVNDFDVVGWWHRQNNMTDNYPKPSIKREQQTQQTISAPVNNTRIKPLYDPHQGAPGARRPSETIPDFLSRLPPSTSDWEPGFDWIWIANPYHPPPELEPALAQFRHAAEERLGLFAEFEKMATLTAGRDTGVTVKALAALRQDVAKERRETVSDLRELADACNVVTGKWMLFPPPGEVDAVWACVAAATAEGELGTAAKVETRSRADKERLVCVYTKDCREKEDVARVLIQMRELGLVKPGGKQIYYKSDAWTELGIYGGNKWGIGASMYSSNEIFGYTKLVVSRRA